MSDFSTSSVSSSIFFEDNPLVPVFAASKTRLARFLRLRYGEDDVEDLLQELFLARPVRTSCLDRKSSQRSRSSSGSSNLTPERLSRGLCENLLQHGIRGLADQDGRY